MYRLMRRRRTDDATPPAHEDHVAEHDSARGVTAPHHGGHRNPTSYGRGTGRRLKIIAIVFAIALVVAYVAVNRIRQGSEDQLAQATERQSSLPPAVVVVTAEKAAPTVSLTLPGSTAAWYESTIYARVNGYVGKWYVDIGDRVKKGQVLAEIETPDLDAQLAGAGATLKSAEAEVHVKQAQAEFAKTTYERWRDSPKGVVSDQERDAKKADYDGAVAQLNAAMANVNTDRGEVDRLTALTQFKQVTAPFDGRIVERHIDIGNLVTAGSTSNTSSLYRMSQDDPMRVFVDVPQNVAGDMTVGVPATISVDGIAGRTFSGAITRTANALDPNARTLRVEVDIPNADGSLVPGLYAQIDFQLKTRGLVQVPASAMVFRSKGPQVAVVGADNVVRFQDVQILRDDGSMVELAGGVSPGDKVALNISNEIGDGDKVSVTEQGAGKGTATPAQASAK